MNENARNLTTVLARNLLKCQELEPEKYCWSGVDRAREIAVSMVDAGLKNVYNILMGKAMKLSCKELGIKPTYKEIGEYLKD